MLLAELVEAALAPHAAAEGAEALGHTNVVRCASAQNDLVDAAHPVASVRTLLARTCAAPIWHIVARGSRRALLTRRPTVGLLASERRLAAVGAGASKPHAVNAAQQEVARLDRRADGVGRRRRVTSARRGADVGMLDARVDGRAVDRALGRAARRRCRRCRRCGLGGRPPVVAAGCKSEEQDHEGAHEDALRPGLLAGNLASRSGELL